MAPLTMAGIVATLYGDPDDWEFSRADPWVPTKLQVEVAMMTALEAENWDAAELLREELARMSGEPMRGTTRALCYGSKAGLWRLQ